MDKYPLPTATLSLDLDNTWSYLKIHGDPNWQEAASHFPLFIPKILKFLKEHNQTLTFFVVGKDAKKQENHPWLKAISESGHEFGNHSFHHEPWIQTLATAKIIEELQYSHETITTATGKSPVGYRGPGFSVSKGTLKAVQALNYQFDASVLPSVIGPIARLYYLATMKEMKKEEKGKRDTLFGSFTNCFYPNSPFRWKDDDGDVLEIPVTTIPLIRLPFHLSYLLWLLQFSEIAAWSYFKIALSLCRLFKVSPSILLHPTDFLDETEVPELSFFPAMQVSSQKKYAFVGNVLKELQKHFQVVPLSVHAENLKGKTLKTLLP